MSDGLINPKGRMQGGFRSVASDGLISESTGQKYPKNSTILYEGKIWEVAGYDPTRQTYNLKNGELFITITEVALLREQLRAEGE